MAHSYVTFESDFSTDDVRDEHGNLVAPPGREIASLLHKSLAKVADKTTNPEQEEDFGWRFGCSVERVKLQVHIMCSMKWGVYFEVAPSLLIPFHLWSGRKAQQIVYEAIDQTIRNDSRIRAIEWHKSKDEYDEALTS